MKKKVCNACNLEFAGDLEKCPVCGKSLFEMAADVEVNYIKQLEKSHEKPQKE
jgi:rRNA maturation endonuclease Nob1